LQGSYGPYIWSRALLTCRDDYLRLEQSSNARADHEALASEGSDRVFGQHQEIRCFTIADAPHHLDAAGRLERHGRQPRQRSRSHEFSKELPRSHRREPLERHVRLQATIPNNFVVTIVINLVNV
jgi:hypothetical protein